jgi:hypothetical protein
MCKKEEEQLFDSIPGTPKRFSFHELKVATSNFSVKLESGGFGSVFEVKQWPSNVWKVLRKKLRSS